MLDLIGQPTYNRIVDYFEGKVKEKGLIEGLKPIFEALLKNKRFYALKMLNQILKKYNEDQLENVT
ncbi:MAG TPA: hypothetical protein VJ953_02305 [Saprospiraceae bacterium]|nr:hypothetical protein [Saprospiraceae bacterium]